MTSQAIFEFPPLDTGQPFETLASTLISLVISNPLYLRWTQSTASSSKVQQILLCYPPLPWYQLGLGVCSIGEDLLPVRLPSSLHRTLSTFLSSAWCSKYEMYSNPKLTNGSGNDEPELGRDDDAVDGLVVAGQNCPRCRQLAFANDALKPTRSR